MADSSLAKIDRATKHIDELNELLRKNRAFSYIAETNEKTGECATYAERNEAVISDATTIAGDAIQNMRAALDHAYWEIVSPFAASARDRKNVQFPFSETAARLDEAAKHRLADRVSVAFFQAVLALRPHGEPGGNELLYAVHEFGAVDRHRSPTPVGEYKKISGEMLRRQIPHFPSGIMSGGFGNNYRDVVWNIQPLAFLKGEFVFKRELDVPVDIVLSIGPTKDLRPMVPTLYAMRDKAKEAIQIIRSA